MARKSGADYYREDTERLAKGLVSVLRTLPAEEREAALVELCKDARIEAALVKAVGPGALSTAIQNLTVLGR